MCPPPERQVRCSIYGCIWIVPGCQTYGTDTVVTRLQVGMWIVPGCQTYGTDTVVTRLRVGMWIVPGCQTYGTDTVVTRLQVYGAIRSAQGLFGLVSVYCDLVMKNMMCRIYLSIAVRKIVWAEPFLKCTSMLLER